MKSFTRAFGAVLALRLYAALACMAAVGQATSPQAERYTWRNVEIGGGGGFVDGILFHPKQPDLIYARTDIGGVYRWDARARRWIALTDWVGQDDGNLRGAESIAVDPTDPNRVYVAAGTYSQPALKTAILRSTDQGRTWQQTPMPLMMGGNEDGRSIGERLAVDPNHPRTLYFGSRHDGLWRSGDYGASWAKVDSFPAVPDNPPPARGDRRTPPRGAGVGWVVFDARSGMAGQPTPAIYVGVAVPDIPTLYRSTDAGATWQAVPGQPRGLIPHHGVLDSDGSLYLTYGNGIGPNGVTDGAVWKYNTRDGVWADITPVRPTADHPGGYAGLTVDAQHPGTVMVSTLDRWNPGDEVFRSTDGGAHWRPLSLGSTRDATGAPWLKWGDPQPRFGWWIGTLELDPFHMGRALYGTGATIWGTDDVTQADQGRPTHWKMYAEGIEETAVTALISPPAGPPLISGLGDIGGFTHHALNASPPEGMSSNPIFTTTSGLDFAGRSPAVVARVGSASRGGRGGAYSLDGGQTWTPFAAVPEGSRGSGAIAVTADGGTLVWASQGAPVSCSRDHGATWTACAGLPRPDPSSPRSYFGQSRLTLAADRVNPNTVYAFNGAAGTLLRSTDGGASFSPVAAANLPAGSNGLVATPGKEGDLWVTAGDNGLYHSTGGGATFTKMPNVARADGLGLGKAAPSRSDPALYLVGTPATVGAVHGVYRSDDGGASWVRINDDQHQYGWIGQPITGDPRVYGRVYLGTNGRGILYADPAHP
ncbi:MAG: carbohydrate-binding protein [Armatimonadetes bacterium]|nr:carbohydrate-binding protein [Armatimonadota bacterium]